MERLFQGLLPPRDTCESWKSQPRPLLARHGPYPTASATPYAAVRTSSMGSACSPASTIPSGARNAPAHARLTLQALRAPRQSSEQAERNRASLRSSLVLRR